MSKFGIPNPLVRAVLGSRAHRLMSGALVVLTVRGRKTGREHVFPTMYARAGDEVIIVAGWASQKRWWKNLVDGAEIELLLAGEHRRGHAVVVGDGPERGRLLRLYTRRFAGAAKGLGLPKDPGSVDDAELSRRLGDAVVVRVALEA